MLLLTEKIKKTIWVYTTSEITNDFDKSDSNSKLRLTKFINFLSLLSS